MKTRNLGSLSSAQLVRIADGIQIVYVDIKPDKEEGLRLDVLFAATAPLQAETDARVIDNEPEARVGAIDAIVDRKFGVLRDFFECGSRLDGAVGEECSKLLKKYFPDGISFTTLDSQLQLAHGTSLVTKLLAEPMSATVNAFANHVLVGLKKDHVEYKSALDEKLLYVKATPQLQIAREIAIDALEDFVSYVDVMSKKNMPRAKRILAPVDTMLESIRRPVPRKKDDDETPTDPQ